MTTDRDRLAALLSDLFPVVSRSFWPFTVEQAADALIRSGVTVPSTWDDDDRSKANVRVLGLTLDELRAAVATADLHHPQWRSSQKPTSSQGE